MVRNDITVENAEILFRNFTGKPGKYNPAGQRNFCWLIRDFELAKQLAEDGWNIRYLNPREEGDDPQPYMSISVGFGKYPPKIVIITSSGKSILNEDTVNILDWAEIDNVDMIIRPYNWEVNNKGGVKAYVKSMYVTIKENDLEKKYSDVPDSAQSAMVEEDYGY